MLEDINDIISEPTAFKNAPAIIYEDDINNAPDEKVFKLNDGPGDFSQLPEQEKDKDPENKPAAEIKEKVRNMPVEFTTEFVVDTIERIVNTPMFLLHNRKNRKNKFGDKETFAAAQEMSYLPADELAKLDIDNQILAKKYMAHKAKMQKIFADLDFTPKQKEKLSKPLSVIVKKHNYDIPPGLAFSIALADIIVERVIDLAID